MQVWEYADQKTSEYEHFLSSFFVLQFFQIAPEKQNLNI